MDTHSVSATGQHRHTYLEVDGKRWILSAASVYIIQFEGPVLLLIRTTSWKAKAEPKVVFFTWTAMLEKNTNGRQLGHTRSATRSLVPLVSHWAGNHSTYYLVVPLLFCPGSSWQVPRHRWPKRPVLLNAWLSANIGRRIETDADQQESSSMCGGTFGRRGIG